MFPGPAGPLDLDEQLRLARLPIQFVLDRPGRKGGSARARLYEEHVPDLAPLDELGLTVRGRERREEAAPAEP